MHTFKKKKSDGQKDDMRFLTLVTGNFHGILHHVLLPLHCGLRGAKTGTKMPYDDFFLEVKYIS